MRIDTRRWLLLPAIVALVAAGCGGDDDSDDSGSKDSKSVTEASIDQGTEGDLGTPVVGGTLTIGLEAETDSWLPGTGSFGNAGTTVAIAIYDPLVARTADGDVQPYLAESVEPNATFDVWTLTLRPDIKFHDGTSLTAQVLKSIFDEYLTAPTSNTAGVLAGITMKVVDDLTVEYRLEQGNSAFLDLLINSPGWPFSVEAAKKYGEDAGANPVGTGPFVFDSWTRDGELRVTRNESYWKTDADGNQLPYLDAVVFKPITDENTRVASLESGGIDAMQTLRQSTVAAVRDLAESGSGFKAFEWLGNNAGVSIINTYKAPFDDVRVRRALAYALDQDQLIEVLGGTGITPRQTQYFSADSPYYSEDAAEAWPNNDPDQAKQLLDEYVNDPERSDGLAPGTPVSFTYSCPPDPSLVELSQAYQAFWQNVGFEVDLEALEQSELIAQALGLDSDPLLAGTYDVQCFRLGSEDDPYTVLSNSFGDWTTNSLNFTNFVDPLIDSRLEVLRGTDDFETRKEAVEKISLLLAEEVPNTWTGSTATSVGARSAVKNVTGWTMPDGTEGSGVSSAVIRTVQVWIDES